MKRSRLTETALTVGCFVLVACQPSENTAAPQAMYLSPPAALLQVRAVDSTQLQPTVTLSNGQTVSMQKADGNNWTGTANVSANTSYTVSIAWVEKVDNKDLKLAQWNNSISVGDQAHVLNLGIPDYNYALDFDNDGISNLDERRNNTDPFTAASTTTGSDTTTGTTTGGGTTDTTAGDTTGGGTTDTTAGDTTDGGTTDTTAGDTTDGGTTGTTAGDTTGGTTTGSSIFDDADVIIPRIEPTEAPVIDGLGVQQNANGMLTGEWQNAVQHNAKGEPLLISHLMIDNNADAEDLAPLRSWAAMHDGEYLYIMALSDDIGRRTSDSSLLVWNDDALEVFFDGDYSQNSIWGDDDDFHLLLPLLPVGSSDSNDETQRYIRGSFSSQAPLAFNFTTGPGAGPDGIREAKWEQDVYEIRIKLSSVGIEIGALFGFELQIDDDDDGGGRDSKWGWIHPSRIGTKNTDETYLNPSYMGSAILQD